MTPIEPSNGHEPVDPAPLARVLRRLLQVYVVVEVLVVVAALVSVGQYDAGGRDRGDDWVSGYSLVEVVASLVCAVPFLRWTYRVVANARRADPAVTLSPGWAVGWYFVPVLNLWRPYNSLRVAWLSEEAQRLGRSYDPPGVFPLWWLAWVGSQIADRLSEALYKHADVSALRASSILDALSSLLNIVAALALMTVVRRLTELQSTRLKGVSTLKASPG